MPKTLFALLLVALLAPVATASAQSTVSTPSAKVLYKDGHTNRFLMDGPWLFRLDAGRTGVRRGFQRSTSTSGWSRTTVPNAWNATDESPLSMRGAVGWYRKDFRLPNRNARLDWLVRFESANYRTQAWLNGRRIGRHRGAYLPFELSLPRGALRRGGVNRLVVRIDSKRSSFDLPPAGTNRTAQPIGGWWNYGGLLREVYLRPAERVAIDTVQVLPSLPCRTCTATVRFKVRVKNLAGGRRRVAASARFGGRAVRFSGSKAVTRRGVLSGRVRVPAPKLWSPRSPNLYPVTVNLRSGARVVGSFKLRSGLRSVKVSRGRLLLNGRPVNVRGFGFHEDHRQTGMAVTNEIREGLIDDMRAAGGSMMRSHYPLHPYFHERADELGMLVWSEAPMYGVKTDRLTSESLRKRGAAMVRDNVLANANHPSIATWSVGNELSAKPGPSQADYMRRASRAARGIDDTRPISYAVAAYAEAGCQNKAYAPLSIIGFNEYFGWYAGPNGQLADRTKLSLYLDQIRRCYPDKALMITEFGFEANREGPVEEKGTYAHQAEQIQFHHDVFKTKPWLSGVLYWTIKEFRVKPKWEGGNPRPAPPIHQKAIIDFDGNRKPGFATIEQAFKAIDQYPGE